MNSLQILELNNNRIVSINKKLFQNLSNLNILLLNFNQIETIENGSFEDLKKLERLELMNNPITNCSLDCLETNKSCKITLQNVKIRRIRFFDQ